MDFMNDKKQSYSQLFKNIHIYIFIQIPLCSLSTPYCIELLSIEREN